MNPHPLDDDPKVHREGGYTVTYRIDASLRDYFAAAALTGILSNPADGPLAGENIIAGEAWAWADAMLRTKNTPAQPTKPTTPFLRESKVYLYLELQRFMKGFEEVGQDSNSETFRQALDVLWYGMTSTERAAVEGKK